MWLMTVCATTRVLQYFLIRICVFASIASQLLTKSTHIESIWNRFHSLTYYTLAVAMVATMTAAAMATTAAECPACCSLVASSCSFVAFVYVYIIFILFLFLFGCVPFCFWYDVLWLFSVFFSAVCSLTVCVRVPSFKAVFVLATANQHCLSSGISMWFWVSVLPAVFCRHTDIQLNAVIHTHNTLALALALARERSSFIVLACEILSSQES